MLLPFGLLVIDEVGPQLQKTEGSTQLSRSAELMKFAGSSSGLLSGNPQPDLAKAAVPRAAQRPKGSYRRRQRL